MPAGLPCEDLWVGLEIRDSSLDPPDKAFWDTTPVYWDQGEPVGIWADDYPLLYNANKECRGFVLERGRQSNWDDILAATLTLELDNTTGVFSIFGQSSFPRISPGFTVVLKARYQSLWYTLFVGDMTEYTEVGEPQNFTVTIKCVDGFRRLMDPIEGDYNPGTDAQPIKERIENLLIMGNLGNEDQYIETGTATMTNYATSRSLLDELRITARSDCGMFIVDNDGTFVYLNRDRIYGRDISPRPIPNFGDGCNTHELPYAAVEPIVADNEFGNVITVANVSQGNDSPAAGMAVDQASINTYGQIPWSPPQLLICNASFVQGVADFQLSRRSQAFYRINSFECYPAHNELLWDTLLPMRLGDPLTVTRRPPASYALYGVMLVDGMRIEATPDLWKFTIRCSPAASTAAVAIRWNVLTNFWDDGQQWA